MILHIIFICMIILSYFVKDISLWLVSAAASPSYLSLLLCIKMSNFSAAFFIPRNCLFYN